MGVSVTTQNPPSDLTYFSSAGQLFVASGTTRFRFPFDATILGVSAAVGIAPVGAPVVLDVNKNGTTIFPAPPAATYRSFSSATGTSTTAAVSKPSSVVGGDMLVLMIRDQNDNNGAHPTLTLPTGFTWRNDIGEWSSSSSQSRISVATKIADGTEGATFTTTFSGNVTALSWNIWCVAFPNVTVYAGSTESANFQPTGPAGTSAVLGSITVPNPGGALLVLVNTGGTPSLPAGMTSLVNTTQFRLAYELLPAAGPTGSRTSTFTDTGDWRALMVGFGTGGRIQPTIAEGTNAASELVPGVTAVSAGDHLTVDVDQAGLGGNFAGSDLSVFVRYGV